MEKTNFDQLLDRYLNGQLPEREKNKLEAWLNVVKTKYKKELVLTPEDEDRLFAKITDKIDNLDDVVSFLPEYRAKKDVRSRSWFRIAASMLLVAAASYGIWFLQDRAPETKTTGTQEQGQKKILQDGTIVWLQQGASLTYDEQPLLRHASLTGEALFEVTKDASRPFTITCGNVTATVLGTSFNIKSGTQDVELTVLTGKVKLSSPLDTKGISVLPREKVIYRRDGNVKKITVDTADLNTIASYTEYNMQFSDTPMSEVIARMEKKFDIHISPADKALVNCRITADFTDQSLDKTLQILAELLDLDYEIRGSAVVISGHGCN